MRTAEVTEVGGYELTLTPIVAEDIPKLHELSVSVSWPHRAEDWAMMLKLGTGWAARDEIGRIMGSAMWFPFGPKVASIGMVITSPRLQENGAGRWLMKHALAATSGRARMLNATKAAFRLYVSLGFTTLATVHQQNGIVTHVPAYPDHARPMRPEDLGRIRDLDQAAMGVPRPEILSAVFDAIEGGTVIERDGRLTGFALIRRFGRGRVIGPVVALSDADAMALCGPLIAQNQGQFLRVDTREPEGAFREFLSASGIVEYDTVQRMSLEPLPEPEGPQRTYGLVSQALT